MKVHPWLSTLEMQLGEVEIICGSSISALLEGFTMDRHGESMLEDCLLRLCLQR